MGLGKQSHQTSVIYVKCISAGDAAAFLPCSWRMRCCRGTQTLTPCS
jgi:hypothetical protein